jgi:hypothetical protein
MDHAFERVRPLRPFSPYSSYVKQDGKYMFTNPFGRKEKSVMELLKRTASNERLGPPEHR